MRPFKYENTTRKEKLEQSNLSTSEQLLSLPSTRTEIEYQQEAVYTNWKSLHWLISLRVSKTTNCEGWQNYTMKGFLRAEGEVASWVNYLHGLIFINFFLYNGQYNFF